MEALVRRDTSSKTMVWGSVLLLLGSGVLIGFIALWWNQTQLASLGYRLVVGLGFAIGVWGLAWLAGGLVAQKRSLWWAYVPPALTLWLALLMVEALLRAYQVPVGLIPTPTRVIETLWLVRDVLLQDAFQTFVLEALVGYLVGVAVGLLIAYTASRYVFLERGLLPYATIFSSIPIVALAPVMVKLMGLGWDSKAAIVAITVVFPVVVNTFRGLTEVSNLSLDLMRSYAASDGQAYRWLRIPNALPFVFNALKIGTTLAMIGAIVGEFFGTNGQGLGFRIQIEAGRFGFDIVWAAIIVASVIGIAWYNLVAALEKRFTGWHVSFRE